MNLTEKARVLEKCDRFVEFSIWPSSTVIDPRSWLKNFTDEEQPYAAHLLHSFMFFSEPLTDSLLHGAFVDLARYVVDPELSMSRAKAQWRDFLASIVITFPTGEVPNPTDSGLAFARKARQILGLPEERIMSPGEALEYVHSAIGRESPVVFLDDFLGSGSQFAKTWVRDQQASTRYKSFAEASCSLDFDPYYVPLLACEKGVKRITDHYPEVTLAPAHFIPSEYSALHEASLIWPPEFRERGQSMIEQASLRANIPNWKGFSELGLAMAFSHSTPDATLPLFYFEENGWRPLVRRT